ncbi:hypothetical protein CK507_10435 [Pseudomonas sp. WN033]|nr:hypothetical protein CK507_10435 [Pseudomonas sp. WN033]
MWGWDCQYRGWWSLISSWERGMRVFLLGLVLGSWVMLVQADEASHRASAERFLKLAKAEGMTATVYEQVGRALTLQFTQMGGSMQHEDLLRDYQRQARELLDTELAWEAMRDELIDLYIPLFSEAEFEQLAEFYQSPVGRKLMDNLPELTQSSLAITRTRWEERLAPQIEELVEQLAADLEDRQGGLR